MLHSYDVVVVGAGPAGSTTAALLAGAGHRVVLLDRAHFPRPKPCAEYMSPGVVDVLNQLGLADVFSRAHPHPLFGMDIVAPSGTTVRIEYREGDGLRRAYTLTRSRFDALLVEHAVACGAKLIEGFVARAPLTEAGVVQGVQGGWGGRDCCVRGTLTVIADGSHSILARRLRLARAARWPVRLGLVAHYEGEPVVSDGHGAMHVGRDGYCGVAPLPDGQVNVAMVLPVDTVSRSRLSATQVFEEWIRANPGLRRSLSTCRRAAGVRGIGPVGVRTTRTWSPGTLLVGDAAGFFDPFTGEGIYRALIGARIAARIAEDALAAGDVSDNMLGRHDAIRREAFVAKAGVTALVQLFVNCPALLEYGLPRLRDRQRPRDALGRVLGDITAAREFLRPRMLWDALRP